MSDDLQELTDLVSIPYANSKGSMNFPEPNRGSSSAAGYDLRVSDSGPRYGFNPGQRHLISTDLHLAIPEGYCGMVCSRSGLALKQGLIVLNAPGIIDADYRGEVGVVLMNLSSDFQIVTPGQEVAQLLIVPFAEVMWQLTRLHRLPATDRGSGGFGSTGL